MWTALFEDSIGLIAFNCCYCWPKYKLNLLKAFQNPKCRPLMMNREKE